MLTYADVAWEAMLQSEERRLSAESSVECLLQAVQAAEEKTAALEHSLRVQGEAMAELKTQVLTYAHVCSRMLTYAHVWRRWRSSRRKSSRMLTYAHVCC
jgi:hypothetical protein